MNDEPSSSLNVPITIGNNSSMHMFIDSGCSQTIIPPEFYKQAMGRLVESDTELLKTQGMINTELTTNLGAQKTSKVYVVEGFHAEPLLGYEDAEELGFIKIHKEGRSPTQAEQGTGHTVKKVDHQERENAEGKAQKTSTKTEETPVEIPNKIRKYLKTKVITHPTEEIKIPKDEVEKVSDLVEKFKGSVFEENKVGKIKTAPVHLEYINDFKPQQPHFRNVPMHYRERVSALLQFPREQKVITDVDPRKLMTAS